MKIHPRTLLSRLILFSCLWLLLAGAQWKSPAVALLAISGGAFASLSLWPDGWPRIHWKRVPALAFYFFGRSLAGGIDVARRAFSPSLPVAPGFITYETRLGTNAGRVIFTWMIGLMPGSSSVDLDSRNRITVHVIDPALSGREDLAILEDKLAAVIDPN